MPSVSSHQRYFLAVQAEAVWQQCHLSCVATPFSMSSMTLDARRIRDPTERRFPIGVVRTLLRGDCGMEWMGAGGTDIAKHCVCTVLHLQLCATRMAPSCLVQGKVQGLPS